MKFSHCIFVSILCFDCRPCFLMTIHNIIKRSALKNLLTLPKSPVHRDIIMPKLKCPACPYEMPDEEASVVVVLLKIHSSTAHPPTASPAQTSGPKLSHPNIDTLESSRRHGTTSLEDGRHSRLGARSATLLRRCNSFSVPCRPWEIWCFKLWQT